MKIRKNWFPILLVLALTIGMQEQGKAQLQFGIEAGTTIASLQPNNSRYALRPRIGTRAGFNLAYDFNKYFYLRSGIFYSLKGSSSSSLESLLSYNLHTLSLPVLATFKPIEQLHVGVGVDVGVLLNPNYPYITTYRATLGLRAEITWQINHHLRLIGHFNYDLTPAQKATVIDDQGMPIQDASNPVHYYNMGGGLSLAHTLFKMKPNK